MTTSIQNESIAGFLTTYGLAPYFSGISAAKDGTTATQLDVTTTSPQGVLANGHIFNPGTVWPATQNIAVSTVNGTYQLYATATEYLGVDTVTFYVAAAAANTFDIPIATIVVAGNVISTVTAISPGNLSLLTNKGTLELTNTVARTDTAAKTLFTLPSGATIIGISISSPTASNAGTTATLNIGVSGTAGKFVSAFDVKGATGAGQQSPTPLAAWGAQGAGAAQVVQGIYAETGSASNTGGPWTVTVAYTL